MGIDSAFFMQLADVAGRYSPKGRVLMLGRQTFRVEKGRRELYAEALKEAGIDVSLDALEQEDGYAETMLAALGFGSVETLDFSGFEGAQVLHDLNKPVPEALHGAFDLIIDGGTLEHVFNMPQALENVYLMLSKGGRFVSINGMNGWVGHGMYQFGPELVWTYWKRRAGATVHRCKGLSKVAGRHPEINFPDPALTGKRLRLKGKIPPGRVYLYYEVEKTSDKGLGDETLQSDYVARWTKSEPMEATL